MAFVLFLHFSFRTCPEGAAYMKSPYGKADAAGFARLKYFREKADL
jgi:hypothetical protein